MDHNLENSNIAVIGGGQKCLALLQAVFSAESADNRPRILGVMDKNSLAVGFKYAKDKGIFTTHDLKALFSIKDLDLIIDLTQDVHLKEAIKEAKPPWVVFVDQYEAHAILAYFQIRQKKMEVLKELQKEGYDRAKSEDLFEEFYNFVLEVNQDRDKQSHEIRENLVANQWSMSQIIQGSTIPTFVIDKDHVVTYWNRACENLTGHAASDIVGTQYQWKPFRSEKRPTMADLIIDGVIEEELWRHYGTGWQKSDLIEGAYEAEEFFTHLGTQGTWLYFTAAPIKGPDGLVVGAIETLWDRTREKQAEEARERQNKELALKVRELTISEQAMSQIIQGSTIPTFVINKAHEVTHWNKALEKLSGFRSEEIVGTRKQWMPFYDKERPSMADVILDQVDELEVRKLYGTRWRKSVLIDGAYEAEVFFPNLGDSGKWCWFTAAPIRTPDGDIVGAIETIWDRTEDKKVEKERERHTRELATFCSIYATLSGSLSLEDRIKTAIQETANIFLADGICIFLLKGDGEFQLTYNYGYSENLCYRNRVAGENSPAWGVAQSGKIAVLDELPDSAENETALLRQEGFKSLVYIPIVDKAKKTFGVIRVGSKKTKYFGPDEIRALELIGNRIGVAIENSLLQEEVRRRARFQAKLIGSSNDGIVAMDNQWKIVVFNPAAENIFGYSGDEVIGKMDARAILPPPIATTFDKALKVGGSKSKVPWQETSIVSKAAEDIPVRFSGTVLREGNRMMGIVAFFQDLREIKRLEKELLGAERLAAVGQTVAGMAHCIKNILHGLKGGSYLVNTGINKNKTDKLKSGWQMVQRNIGRTSDLVQDLLSYSKEREPEYQPCLPNEIADDVCELVKENAAEHNIDIVKSFSPAIGEVVMDHRTIHRCLLNLVSNAIDACRFDDSIEKKHCVSVTTALEKDKFIRFEVKDNGSGMSDEVKARLFSSFFSTKGAQGTGLGLLVTSKLIEEHNGTIAVTSREGEGTTFSVRLPFEIEQNAEEND